MAKRIPTQFVVAAFTAEDAVDHVEKEIMDAEFESKQVLCTNLATAKKDIAGKLQIKEMGNPAALHGKPVGGHKLLGGLSLMLMGNKGGVRRGARLGGSISQYGAANVEGMDKEKLGKIGAALKPGTSAIILVFDEVFVDVKYDAAFLKDYKESTDSMASKVAAKIKQALDAGKDITYHFVIDEKGFAISREIEEGSNGPSNISDLIITPFGIATYKQPNARAPMATHNHNIAPELYASTRAAMTKNTVAYTTPTTPDDAVEI